MKIHRLFFTLLILTLSLQSLAFEWTGGTLNIPVVFRGEEVFAGWVPSSPWGATPFLRDPVVELRNEQNAVIAEHAISGGAMDWYSGGTRAGIATVDGVIT